MMMAGMHPLLRLMDFIRLIDVASKELETFIYDDSYDPAFTQSTLSSTEPSWQMMWHGLKVEV